MEGEARVSVEPLPHFRMPVGGVVVEDHVHDFSAGTCASMALRKRINSCDDGAACSGR